MKELTKHIDKIHTTPLGAVRIKKNLGIETDNVIEWCKTMINNAKNTIKKGKNWYVYTDDVILTVNAHSYTIITAHKNVSLT